MTVEVTMLQTRWGEDGTLWASGTTHAASLEFAQYLIGNQFATGTLPTAMQSYPCTMLVATTAELAAMSGEPGVFYAERDGVQRLFRWVGGAMEEVGSGGGGSGTHLGTLTAASMLATPSPVAGWTCRVSDLGNLSPWFEYRGSAWRPVGGRQLAFLLADDTPELTTTGEQLLVGCSCPIPAGVLDYSAATLRVEHSVDKGTTTNVNTGTWRLRLGPGSGGVPVVGDVLMYEFSGTARTYSGGVELRRGSATTMRLLGTGSKTSSFDRLHASQNNQRGAAETISSLASTALYLSFWADMSGTGEPIKANRWAVYVMG